ncbi:MAG: transcription antitermination factor NusB [Fimbriiglobus sp.]|nr:transcription antitermination factor NusB [Fimbriiglobus sp.]
MFRRSRAREVALQLLFQLDQNRKPMSDLAVKAFAAERIPWDPKSAAFCLELFAGVKAHRDAIDAVLTATAENWRLIRMLPSDRNVLRLCAYELLHTAEPVPVLINEAVELARRFGTVDSPGFVNGILDKVAQRRKDAAPSSAAPAPETTQSPPPVA